MKRIIIGTFSGLLLSLAGGFFLYLFIASLNTSANMFFFILMLLFLGGGIYILLRTSKNPNIIVPEDQLPPPSSTQPGSLLQKQNNIVAEWRKTMENRDRLKLLEISAKAEE